MLRVFLATGPPHHPSTARPRFPARPSPLRAGHWEALPAATAAQTKLLPEKTSRAGKRTPQTEPTPPPANPAGAPQAQHARGRLRARTVALPGTSSAETQTLRAADRILSRARACPPRADSDPNRTSARQNPAG